MAYRKRENKDRKNLRPKLEPHKRKLVQGQRVRKHTIEMVLKKILPQVYQREAQKQILDRVKFSKFDLQYEEMCRQRGVQPRALEKKPLSFFQPQQAKDALKLKIDYYQPPTPEESVDEVSHHAPQ